MSQKVGENNNRVYRLVLTGGPCGGKTTGQARLCTFFENLGWKVYRVPETATVLIGGGVKWTDLTDEQVFHFQANLMKTMMQIEDTFFDLAASCKQNCLVICDRGTMDATAYLKAGQWERMRDEYGWNAVDLRDSRYNQVIHMVSAAKGAEPFYHTELHATRYENLDLARTLDDYSSQAWVGHPYFDVIDNTTDFEHKMNRMIAAVCHRLSLEAGDRLSTDSKKRKFLVDALPGDVNYPQFQDFIVVHDYLVTPNSKMQARIRRRGQNVKWDDMKDSWNLETGPQALSPVPGPQKWQVSSVYVGENSCPGQIYIFGTDLDFSNWTYTHTIRRPEINKESPERKMQISIKEYELLLQQKDFTHYTIYKKRRCFLWNNQYFQMDIYQEPCHARCEGLIMLETYTTLKGRDLDLPSFLHIVKEVTDNSSYSMYNLSKRDPKDCPAPVNPKKLEALLNGQPELAALMNGHHINGHVEDEDNESETVNGKHSITNGTT